MPHEDAALKELYLVYGIPIDQYERRPVDLRDFVEDWNARSGRRDGSGELIHYMKTKRKKGKWVKFDGKHKVLPPIAEALSPDEDEVLVAIYEEHITALGRCSDILSEEPELATLVSREFAHRTRRRLPTEVLVGRLTQLRKRGMLPVVGTRSRTEGLGFADIDDVNEAM